MAGLEASFNPEVAQIRGLPAEAHVLLFSCPRPQPSSPGLQSTSASQSLSGLWAFSWVWSSCSYRTFPSSRSHRPVLGTSLSCQPVLRPENCQAFIEPFVGAAIQTVLQPGRSLVGCSVGRIVSILPPLVPPFWRNPYVLKRLWVLCSMLTKSMGTGASFYSFPARNPCRESSSSSTHCAFSGFICSRPHKHIPALTVPPLLGTWDSPSAQGLGQGVAGSRPHFCSVPALSPQSLVSLPSSSHVTQPQTTSWPRAQALLMAQR